MQTAEFEHRLVNGKLEVSIKDGSVKNYPSFIEIPNATKLVRNLNIQSVLIKKSQEFDKSFFTKVFKSKK